MARIFNKRWELLEKLSEGGQGHTYLVRDLAGDRHQKFVLKRLKNLKRLGRFKREVAAMLKLDHNDILKVVDHHFEDDEPYIVSDFCAGGTLTELMQRGRPSITDAFRLFIHIADAVNYAHSEGVVHRDLKPDNIFLRPPTFIPLIGDFGLCYLEEAENVKRETELHEAVGPRMFMAPELEDGRMDRIDPSVDIYSLGKILYWLFSGEIFSREKFREGRWNLGQRVQHPYEPGFNLQMEHINRLLDQMIVEDPQKRAKLGDIILSAKRIAQLVARSVNPVTTHELMNCTFCGWGKYTIIHTKSDVYNFGFAQVGNPDWRILACDQCGHIQLFRVDHIRGKYNWWVH